jgi:hypothetical protein
LCPRKRRSSIGLIPSRLIDELLSLGPKLPVSPLPVSAFRHRLFSAHCDLGTARNGLVLFRFQTSFVTWAHSALCMYVQCLTKKIWRGVTGAHYWHRAPDFFFFFFGEALYNKSSIAGSRPKMHLHRDSERSSRDLSRLAELSQHAHAWLQINGLFHVHQTQSQAVDIISCLKGLSSVRKCAAWCRIVSWHHCLRL